MKKLIGILLIGIISIGLTGCGAKQPVMGVLIYKYDDQYMSFIKAALEAAGKGKVKLIIKDSENNQAKQNDQVDAILAKKIDVLAVNLVDPGAATIVTEKAQKAGLPVIFFNREYPEGTDKIPYDKVVYVGTNSIESGIIQGELIADAWQQNKNWDKNGDGKMQYVMLMGEPGHPDAEARTKETIGTIESAGIQTQELALQTAMWEAAKAKELMHAGLTTYGDEIEMVICNNDDMAIGAVQALQESGYFEGNRYMPVVGVDGTPGAIELIRSNQLLGTVLNDPLNQGKAIIDLALDAHEGKSFSQGTKWELDGTKAVRVPYIAITQENLEIAEKAYGQQ